MKGPHIVKSKKSTKSLHPTVGGAAGVWECVWGEGVGRRRREGRTAICRGGIRLVCV